MIETWTTVVAVAMVFLAGMAVNDADLGYLSTDDKIKCVGYVLVPAVIFLPIFGRVWGWF